MLFRFLGGIGGHVNGVQRVATAQNRREYDVGDIVYRPKFREKAFDHCLRSRRKQSHVQDFVPFR